MSDRTYRKNKKLLSEVPCYSLSNTFSHDILYKTYDSKTGKVKYNVLHTYSSCRGYIYDNLLKLSSSGKLKQIVDDYFYISHQTSTAIATKNKLQEIYPNKNILDVIAVISSKIVHYLCGKKITYAANDKRLVMQIPIEIYKNLFATSLFYVFFKTINNSAGLPTFVKNHAYGKLDKYSGKKCCYYLAERTSGKKNFSKALIDNWHNIFNEKITWDHFYMPRVTITSLHNMGINTLRFLKPAYKNKADWYKSEVHKNIKKFNVSSLS